VRARGMRGLQNSGGGCLRVEPCDVHCNAAVEQFDILGQITDVLAQGVRRPVIERGVVEPDPAPHARPYPHQCTCQR